MAPCLVAGTLPLSPLTVSASWLVAATQKAVREPNVLLQDFMPDAFPITSPGGTVA